MDHETGKPKFKQSKYWLADLHEHEWKLYSYLSENLQLTAPNFTLCEAHCILQFLSQAPKSIDFKLIYTLSGFNDASFK